MSDDASAAAEIGSTRIEESQIDVPVIRPETGQLRGPSNDNTGNEGLGPEHSFSLDYTDSRGYRWTGDFQSHVLTIGDRAAIGVTRANLFGGASITSMDQTTINLLEAQAYLAVALDKAPEWAKNLAEMRDVGVLYAIYREVASYEARFWGTGSSGSSKVDASEV